MVMSFKSIGYKETRITKSAIMDIIPANIQNLEDGSVFLLWLWGKARQINRAVGHAETRPKML
jgi:hypothetical protein